MAWFSGKVSLGNFPDLAGAVNKISESVKNIEKNFDSALGFEEKTDTDTSEASGLWPTTDTKALFEPMMAFMGNKGGESTVDSIERPASLEPQPPSSVVEKEGAEIDKSSNFATKQTKLDEDINEESSPLHPASAEDSTTAIAQVTNAAVLDHDKSHLVVPGNSGSDSQLTSIDSCNTGVEHHEEPDSITHVNQKETSVEETAENSELMEAKPVTNEADHVEDNGVVPPESHNITNLHATENEKKSEEGGTIENLSPVGAEDVGSGSQPGMGVDLPGSVSATSEETESPDGRLTNNYPAVQHGEGATQMGSEPVSHEHDTVDKAVDISQQTNDFEPDTKESVSSGSTMSDITESVVEVEKLKREMKMMETALQGAARQAQAKADEISKLMNENENLKAVIEDLRRKSSESEIESLREEYHQRVAALERKVYALTRERDTLRREQSKKSDAAALLKEKDEIINQVMAEGEELSKKQAAQESHIRKLRAQIRELEEEKKGLSTKLQVEENKVESIKKDKAATEKLLQESIEKHQAELAAQKEFYTNALNAAKEAEALAEARANNEARTELESRLREAEERETMLVQTLEELRQTLSRKEQQAVFREDMLCRDIEDLQKRYQASERRCEELVTQLPESTRPLLRQIEAMQETTARRAEAWAAVERSLTSRLQEAEAKAAAAEERERSVNERLSQTLSRINVLEAQISCLRAEQTQLSRTLEKERQRAAENRQEYLAAKEEADTHEGRVSQLEEEIKELRRKHKQELQEALTHREFLQKEIEREKAARLELERNAHLQTSTVSDQSPLPKQKFGFENGKLNRKLSSASSLSSMEESFFLQASLDSSDTFSEHRNHGDMPISPYFVKSFTPSAFEATLRQKEGELASYISRLASLEKIRDSLAEELVQMTEQCEKLRAEAAVLPGIRAELEALRRRHSAALELMGERDEELEELRADIVDMKEMYREQVNLLVNKIQILSSTLGSSTT
ncbi:golgin candidate 5 isoform X1 [Diospyros lotus]|uniref:golgin candidate 5 isoform X1 n=2 Tax=Diospyros lotus TaxID=55363 RepID=UPI0022517163|nr:golgin candidate 5 isoform X1 [Diospyros lotus]